MQPITGQHMFIENGALGNFAFVVWELQVHTATMYIEFGAEIFTTHGRALNMPAGKTFAPGTYPTHNMFFRRRLPQGKVRFVVLFLLSFQLAGSFEHFIHYATAEFTVWIILCILL